MNTILKNNLSEYIKEAFNLIIHSKYIQMQFFKAQYRIVDKRKVNTKQNKQKVMESKRRKRYSCLFNIVLTIA